MAGTQEGGMAAAATNKKFYGEDFYAKIGAKGGKRGRTGGFASGPDGRERARIYGAIGGKLSRRGAAKLKPETPEMIQARADLEAARTAEKAEAEALRDVKLKNRLRALKMQQAKLNNHIERLQSGRMAASSAKTTTKAKG